MEVNIYFLILIFVNSLVSRISSYDFVCPGPFHRRLRAPAFCKSEPTDNYACLLDENTNRYNESCSKPVDYVRFGQRYVTSGGRKSINCSTDRYQPFPFYSNQLSQCALERSKCNEIGQILYSRGMSSTDTTCRCKHGFVFLQRTRITCDCNPSEEDCTCYRASCDENNFFALGYTCTSGGIPSRDAVCGSLNVSQDTTENEVSPSLIIKAFDMTIVHTSNQLCSNIVIIALIYIIIGISVSLKLATTKEDENMCSILSRLINTKSTASVMQEAGIPSELHPLIIEPQATTLCHPFKKNIPKSPYKCMVLNIKEYPPIIMIITVLDESNRRQIQVSNTKWSQLVCNDVSEFLIEVFGANVAEQMRTVYPSSYLEITDDFVKKIYLDTKANVERKKVTIKIPGQWTHEYQRITGSEFLTIKNALKSKVEIISDKLRIMDEEFHEKFRLKFFQNLFVKYPISEISKLFMIGQFAKESFIDTLVREYLHEFFPINPEIVTLNGTLMYRSLKKE